MSQPTSTSPRTAAHPGILTLAAILVAFFVAGAAMALVIWITLSDFLAGHPVEGGRYLLAMALVGLFGALAWLLGRYLQTAFMTNGDPHV